MTEPTTTRGQIGLRLTAAIIAIACGAAALVIAILLMKDALA
ncbi:MAG TPA: hypothetical protein VNR66_07500 [Solirubrobacteraceae bacterium]|jgi:hypothetical protein|nr:hypothetical protein [Solirubrobacteraceae bacterium]